MDSTMIFLGGVGAFMLGMALVDCTELDTAKADIRRKDALIHNQYVQLDALRAQIKAAQERVEQLEAEAECHEEELEARDERIEKLCDAQREMEEEIRNNEVTVVNCGVAWFVAVAFTATMVFLAIIKSSPLISVAAPHRLGLAVF